VNARAWLLFLAGPAVAVVPGVTLPDERLGAWVLAGLCLIAVGSWPATRGPRPGRPGAEGLAAG
jgi:hypothetical protein